MTDGTLALNGGLTTTTVEHYKRLLTDITGQPVQNFPYLAPALLLSDPQVEATIPFPVADPGEILIHDYQSIRHDKKLHQDRPITARYLYDLREKTSEFSVDLDDAISLKTALRCVPHDTLATAKPLRFRQDDQSQSLNDLTCTQAQVDTYLDLSGDANPIHRAGDTARNLGLSGPIVPGQLTAALVQPLLENTRPGCIFKDLRARFAAPLCVDQVFGISLTKRPDPKKFRAFLHKDGGAFAIIDLAIN